MSIRANIEAIKPLRRTAIVILYLIVVGGPARVKSIAEDLEIDYETCRSYVRELRDLGIVVRTSAGMVTLSTLGRQLALPGLPIELSAENPRFFVTTTITEESEKYGEVVVNNDEETRKIRVLEMLAGVGILKNNRTLAIVERKYVTPDLLESVIKNMARKGKLLPAWAGLLITQLETESREFHSMGCMCGVCGPICMQGYKAWDSYSSPDEDSD